MGKMGKMNESFLSGIKIGGGAFREIIQNLPFNNNSNQLCAESVNTGLEFWEMKRGGRTLSNSFI